MSEQPSSSSRPEIARTDSGGAPRADASEKTKGAGGPPIARTTRYKEKFLTMKERYEVVNAAHDKYERELALANEKIKKLQNECNLLLDAVDIAVPGQPTLMHYMEADPVPRHYALLNPPYEAVPPPPPPPPAQQTHANGNGHI